MKNQKSRRNTRYQQNSSSKNLKKRKKNNQVYRKKSLKKLEEQIAEDKKHIRRSKYKHSLSSNNKSSRDNKNTKNIKNIKNTKNQENDYAEKNYVADSRKKINIRETWSESLKKIALSKSNGVCCRCGKPLTIQNMTVEHVIPLSKGGTNEISNIVALCEDCNKEKSNTILEPKKYYKYLAEYQREYLQEKYEKYINQEYMDINTFFPEDILYIPNFKAILPLMIMKVQKVKSKKFYNDEIFDEFAEMGFKYGSYNLTKGRYKNLNDILLFLEKKHIKREKKFNKQEQIFKIKEHIRHGAVYILRNSVSEDIVGVIFFRLDVILINNELTIAINMIPDYSNGLQSADLIDYYLTVKLVKDIMQKNDFEHLVLKKMIDDLGNNQFISTTLGRPNGYAKDGYNNILCLYYFYKLGKNNIYHTSNNKLPETVKINTPYFEKLRSFSKTTTEEIIESTEKVRKAFQEQKEVDIHDVAYEVGYLEKKVR